MAKHGKKRARAPHAAASSAKRSKANDNDNDNHDDGDDVDCASLGFADALAVGLAFAQLGAHDSACEAFARAVSLEPRHYGARCQLADAYAETGDMGAALPHYAAASALDEAAADASLWLRLGMAQAAQDQSDAAVTSYEKAKQLAQEQLLSRRAGEDDEVEDDDDARRAYGMALAALAHTLGMERDDVGAAVRVYEDAVATFPQNANLRFNLATMRLANNDRTRAIADLKRAIALDSDVAEFYEELVELLDDGDEKRAMVKKMEELQSHAVPSEEAKAEEEEEEEEESDEEEEEDDEEDEDEDDDE